MKTLGVPRAEPEGEQHSETQDQDRYFLHLTVLVTGLDTLIMYTNKGKGKRDSTTIRAGKRNKSNTVVCINNMLLLLLSKKRLK